MIRPAKFYSNPDTVVDNSFQKLSSDDLTVAAQKEFDAVVEQLTEAGVSVCVIQDDQQPETPDSIFPNNRLSFHSNGIVVVYPMKAENRRKEQQLKTLSVVENKKLFKVEQIIDYSIYEQQNIFLEGTGSMVLDRKNKIVYAAHSQRTDEKLVEKFCRQLGYQKILFDAKINTDKGIHPIYHTNVMLAIAEDFIIISAAVIEPDQRDRVLQSLTRSGREVILITIEQVKKFCGNTLQLKGNSGNKIIAMSKTALESFSKNQIKIIEKHNKIIAVNIPTIEQASGGSVRCMLAEIM